MKKLLILIALFNIMASCQQNEYQVNLAGIDVNIEIERLEKDLFEINIDSIEPAIDYIKKKYGNFLNLYSSSVIRIGNPDFPNYPDNLKLFLTDYSVYQSLNITMQKYQSVQFIEDGLTKAFSYYKYYFSDKGIPQIYTIITGFNQSIIIDENVLAIALDKYLGRDCKIYDRLMINNYIKLNMNKNMIVPDCMKAWAFTEFPYNDSIDNLITNMLYNGKIHYFQRCMLPETPDSIIMGFSQNQIDWCEKYEKQMWEYLVENKLLYNNEILTINKFTKESPFTKDFDRDSPGRAANWLGWQIIKSYMKRNPKVSLPELMKNNNYQEIFLKARYRP